MQIILAIIFGASVAIVCYENYYEMKERKIQKLLAPKVEKLIEISSMKIFNKQHNLKRELTEKEKNEILDECYNQL